MLTREQKKKIVEELTQALREAKSVVFSDFQGLKTKDLQELRQRLKKEKVLHKVAKLTLIKRALAAVGINPANFSFQVPVAVSLSMDDETAAAKIISGFAKTHEQVKLIAGVLGQKLIDSSQVKMLALLPSKQQLRGQVVNLIASPLQGLVGILSANLRGIVNVLSAKIKYQNGK